MVTDAARGTQFAWHLKLVIAAVFWAMTPIFGRLLADYEAPYLLACGRFLVASCALGLLVRLQDGATVRPRARHLPGLVLLGVTGICLHNVLVFMGVEHTEANRANIIFATITIMIAIIDVAVFGRRFHAGALLGILLGVVGTAVVVTDGDVAALAAGAIGRGELLVLGSAASWAVYSVCGRPLLRELPALTVTFYATLFGTAMLVPFALIDADALPRLLGDGPALSMLVFLGLLNSALGFLWYYQALARLGAVVTSAYINLVPIFGLLLATPLLGERPTAALLVGGGFVIGGLVLISRYEQAPPAGA